MPAATSFGLSPPAAPIDIYTDPELQLVVEDPANVEVEWTASGVLLQSRAQTAQVPLCGIVDMDGEAEVVASAIQIGNPVSYERAVKTLQAFDGLVEQVSEDELANAAVRADRTGLYACPHTGVALAALFKLLDKGVIDRNQRVIVISTAHGLKFSRFKVDYHNQGLESVLEQYPNPPLELPADYEVVRGKIDEVSARAN